MMSYVKGDHKYAGDKDLPAEKVITSKLIEFGASQELAEIVAIISTNVSYSKEMKRLSSKHSMQEFQRILENHPELRVVQDADRLDAIGAIGIARTFTFNGTRGNPLYGSPDSCLQHFDDKLLHLEKYMKTETGKALASKGTERLRVFKDWMEEEALFQ